MADDKTPQPDRRKGPDRRVSDDPPYTGPERRKHERRDDPTG